MAKLDVPLPAAGRYHAYPLQQWGRTAMKTAIIVMTLLACDCDGVQCNYLRTVSSGWASLEACQADIEKQLSDANVSYPLLMAQCNANRQEAPAAVANVDENAFLVVANSTDSGKKWLESVGLPQALRRVRGGLNTKALLPSRFFATFKPDLNASDPALLAPPASTFFTKMQSIRWWG